MTAWATRPERAEDVAVIRAINEAAFPTAEEADLVDALRADPDAWIEGYARLAIDTAGAAVGYALLTRCHIDTTPALCLAPCAVLPAVQRRGAGSAAIVAVLEEAHSRADGPVVVLGHAEYYPRFGFRPAHEFGVSLSVQVPPESLMVLPGSGAVPAGQVRYAEAFGI